MERLLEMGATEATVVESAQLALDAYESLPYEVCDKAGITQHDC
jgi:hypothetical protein